MMHLKHVVLALIAPFALAVAPASLRAATITVTSAADSGAGTLRQALASVASGDTIGFSLPTPSRITLTSGELVITNNVTIAGLGSANLAVSGNNSSRVFNIATNHTVVLSGLTIRDGLAGVGANGGGIQNAGLLTMSNCFVVGNRAGAGAAAVALGANGGTGGVGGGVYNSASLAAVACTFSGNTGGAGGTGGGNDPGLSKPGGRGGFGGSGGAIYNDGLLTLVACSFSGNGAGAGGRGGDGLFVTAPGAGGFGGYGGGVHNAGSLTLTSCTLSGNNAGRGGAGGDGTTGAFGGTGGIGGGIYSAAGTVNLRNSLVALNSYGAGGAGGNGLGSTGPNGSLGSAPDLAGAFTSQGHNLVGATNGSSGVVNAFNSDIAGNTNSPVNPVLGPLQDNGGSTFTMALLSCSPAIDAGDDALAGTDQRGLPRFFGAHVDIGAFELQTVPSQDCWALTSAPTQKWVSVASSADGSKLVALANDYPTGPVYVSTNSGATWTQTSAPAEDWVAVASSADGTKLVAVAQTYPTGPVYVSTNSGATWTQTGAPAQQWSGVACSADGKTLVAVAQTYTTGPIYFSTNSGATWTQASAPAAQWSGVASSSDGSNLVAVANTDGIGSIYRSTNSGRSWSPTSAPGQNWLSVASSSDGSKLAAASLYYNSIGGSIHVSTDSGATWTDSGAPISTWASVASSADGSRLVAVAYGGGIYTRQITSALRITAIAQEGNNVRITWVGGHGKTNALQAASSLSGNFTDLFAVPNPTGTVTNYLDVGGATHSSRFYRVRLVP